MWDSGYLIDGLWANELKFDTVFIAEFIVVIILLYVAFLPVTVTLICLLIVVIYRSL